jgi:hypothetical protein
MISNGCLAIVYFVEIIWCVKMTSKANPPEIVRKYAEACAELIPSKSSKSFGDTKIQIFLGNVHIRKDLN